MHRKLYTYIVFSTLIALALHSDPAWAISWKEDLNTALKEAKERRLPVMIDFYTKWCHWCKELDRNTYTDRRVDDLSSNFVCVKLDAEKDAAAAARYDVRGYPTIVFLNPNGSYNSRVTGYRDPLKFGKAMETVMQNTVVGTPGKPGPAKGDALELSGILYNREKAPIAVINNTMVKEGETVGKATVSKITKDKVIVLIDGKTVTLSME